MLEKPKQGCKLCGGTGKEETDLLAKTSAAWQPCMLCFPKDYEKFWRSDNEPQKNWFVNKPYNAQSNPRAVAGRVE